MLINSIGKLKGGRKECQHYQGIDNEIHFNKFPFIYINYPLCIPLQKWKKVAFPFHKVIEEDFQYFIVTVYGPMRISL